MLPAIQLFVDGLNSSMKGRASKELGGDSQFVHLPREVR